MSNFVYGQLVEMVSVYGDLPAVCRYAGIKKDGYVLHKGKMDPKKSSLILHKYIEPMNPRNLFMVPGRSYNFKPGDEVICKVRNSSIGIPTDYLATVESVNEEWKFVVLSEPTIEGFEDSKIVYFEQVLLKNEYDRLVTEG